MHVTLSGVARHHGAHAVLEHIDLTLRRGSRMGVVGPNGAGKSTLLRLLGGIEKPDEGQVTVVGTAGCLPQEPDVLPGETLLETLARRTGVAASERALGQASEPYDADRYAVALDQFLALGGGDLESRAAVTCARLGLPTSLQRETATLSGGEVARAMLASILLSRFDVLLLDEPTTDLDLEGIELLEQFVSAHRGAVAIVSHDRALLEAVVTQIIEVDPWTKGIAAFPGGWSAYEAARASARAQQHARYADMRARERELSVLLSGRRTQARAGGAMADRRGTHALRSKVRQAERLLERLDRVEKPYEPWELRLALEPTPGGAGVLASLDGAVSRRGLFQLGPLSLSVAAGDRIAVTGRNGTGKSTLLALLVGELQLDSGTRTVGRATKIGALDQARSAYATDRDVLTAFLTRTALDNEQARTLLAKFGLSADDLARPAITLSPGERTRAQLAELQAHRANLLVLDEPTNHVDLEAVEQLETVLRTFAGGLVVASHDRRFLEAVAPTQVVAL